MNLVSLLVSVVWLIQCVFILIIGQWGLVQVSENNISLFANATTVVAVFTASILCFWTRKVFAKKDENGKAWLFIGIGSLVWGVGQIILTVFESFPDWSFVSNNINFLTNASDFFYIASIPIIIIGFYHLAKALKARIPALSWIIGGAIFVGAFLLSYSSNWALLFPSEATNALATDKFIFTALYALLYPIMLTYAAVIASILFTGIMGRPWIYVIFGFVIYSIGEIVWNLIDSHGLYTVGSYWDLLWIIGFGFIAIGAIENYYLFKKSY
jgi:hypothetical protein